jgi:methyltransferase (TIGR00027 family)
MLDAGQINDVSDTAYWIAHYRARESGRPDALFQDPLATLLAGEHGGKIAKRMPLTEMTAWSVAVRTRIIDDFISAAIQAGVDLVLNLGAGLDTRPYRLNLPANLRWVEVDYGNIIDYKTNLLADQLPHCHLESYRIDLSDLSARRQLFSKLNQEAERILILTEGVLPYLSFDDAACFAADLKNMDKVVNWIVDYHSPESLKFNNRGKVKQLMKKAPFKFLPQDWFGFFANCGWTPQEMRYYSEVGEDLLRPPPYPWYLKLALMLVGAFASSDLKTKYKRHAGYGLMVPVRNSNN